MTTPALQAPPRTTLVLSATGGIGGETAAALARHGWRIRAIARAVDDAAAAARRAEHCA